MLESKRNVICLKIKGDFKKNMLSVDMFSKLSSAGTLFLAPQIMEDTTHLEIELEEENILLMKKIIDKHLHELEKQTKNRGETI